MKSSDKNWRRYCKEQQQKLKEWTKENPKQLNLVQNQAEIEWGIKASKDTIKIVLKSANLTWHRIRKVLGGQPDETEYVEAVEKILRNVGKKYVINFA